MKSPTHNEINISSSTSVAEPGENELLNLELLKGVERRLSTSVLNNFKVANNITDLEEMYHALYEFWYSLSNDADASHNNNSTLENNIAIENQSCDLDLNYSFC